PPHAPRALGHRPLTSPPRRSSDGGIVRPRSLAVSRLNLAVVHRGGDRKLLSSHHSWITLSARTNSDGGIARPSVLAALRLMISSKFVGCSTGRLVGLMPLRIRSSIDSGATRNDRKVWSMLPDRQLPRSRRFLSSRAYGFGE